MWISRKSKWKTHVAKKCNLTYDHVLVHYKYRDFAELYTFFVTTQRLIFSMNQGIIKLKTRLSHLYGKYSSNEHFVLKYMQLPAVDVLRNSRVKITTTLIPFQEHDALKAHGPEFGSGFEM